VVGDGPQAADLRHAVAELALDGSVRWLGSRDDVPRILACVDALALSSHPRVETFPLCVLEAMAARLPVVATRVGSLPELVEDGLTGVLVPPGNPQAMAEALQRILSGSATGRAMGERGRERVQARFTRRRMVGRTADLFWELARRHAF
jgi:glycosyltransferase involved in cell wall biosynthesis